jgi:hypothetical protein
MVASLKALRLTVLAWVEAPATVKPRARNAGIPTPDLAGKEEDRTGVLVIFGSIGTPKKTVWKEQSAAYSLNIYGMVRITRKNCAE